MNTKEALKVLLREYKKESGWNTSNLDPDPTIEHYIKIAQDAINGGGDDERADN